jgi:hypothetical protein
MEPEKYHGGNCCMTFTDASRNLERGMSSAGGNCCISFGNSKSDEHEWERKKFKLWLVGGITVAFIFCSMLVLLRMVSTSSHPSAPMDD